jgi:hypothetical protein
MRLREALLLGFLPLYPPANYPCADDGRQNIEFGDKLFAVFLRHRESSVKNSEVIDKSL